MIKVWDLESLKDIGAMTEIEIEKQKVFNDDFHKEKVIDKKSTKAMIGFILGRVVTSSFYY